MRVGTGASNRGVIDGEYVDAPDEGYQAMGLDDLDDGDLVEPDDSQSLVVSNPASPVLTGLPWQAAAAQQSGRDADMQQYLNDNPPFDFHEDHAALSALMPERPALPPWQDGSHPMSGTKLGKLGQIMGSIAKGAAAGSAGGNFGQGYLLAQQAANNLQELQLRRQAAQDLSDWHQAQTERYQAETAGMPAKQSAMNRYRNARTDYVEAQTQKLKLAPNDKFVQGYHGADGKAHFVFQRPNGQTYERSSDLGFFVKPEAKPRPLLARGHDHAVWMIDANTGHAQQVLPGHPDVTKHRIGTPGQFANVEQWKNREWRKVNSNILLGDADKAEQLQDIQNQYERLVKTLGGEPIHYDVRSGSQQANSGSNSNDPWNLR